MVFLFRILFNEKFSRKNPIFPSYNFYYLVPNFRLMFLMNGNAYENAFCLCEMRGCKRVIHNSVAAHTS